MQIGLVVPAACIAATWASLYFTPEKMNTVPISPALIDPSGLNACDRFSRRSLELAGPSCAMNEFDPVSRKDDPLAITNCATRKNAYSPACAAG